MLSAVTFAPAFEGPRKWNSSPELQSERLDGHVHAHQTLKVADLPADWDWRDINGTNFLTESRNQHIPTYCGSCWAFGTLSSLNDRLKIARKGAYPDTILAPQVLINCNGGGTCNGGNVGGVFSYMEKHGLPDETCQNYEATDDFKCDAAGVCKTCVPAAGWPKPGYESNCTAIENPPMWTLSKYGYALGGADVDAAGAAVTSAQKLQAEIFANGPLACGIHATDELEAFGTPRNPAQFRRNSARLSDAVPPSSLRHDDAGRRVPGRHLRAEGAPSDGEPHPLDRRLGPRRDARRLLAPPQQLGHLLGRGRLRQDQDGR